MKKLWHYLVIFEIAFVAFPTTSSSTSIGVHSKSSYPLLMAFIDEVNDNFPISRNATFLNSLQNIQDIFSKETHSGEIYLSYDYLHHLLHTYLFKVTLEVTRSDQLKFSWENFLIHAEQHTVIIYPNKKSFKLNLSLEKELLSKPILENRIKIIRPAVLTEVMLDQIMEIENQSFSEPYRTDTFLYFQADHANRFILLALNPATQVIEGFLLYNQGIIASVARRVNTPGLGVGMKLFEELAKILGTSSFKSPFLRLEVRQSNAKAIDFYKAWGFRKAYVTKVPYYRYPEEKAQVMICPSNRFRIK